MWWHNRDRLTCFGFHYLQTLLEEQGRQVEVVNLAEHDKEDLSADLVTIFSSFTAQLYEQRRAKHKAEAMVRGLGGRRA